MSKYSTEVRFICESLAGYVEQQGYGSVDDILTDAAPKVFDFDFPIFDEDYRLGLEKKILKHFYTREISAETVGLWKLWLNERMNLIMPYYNQLYESELIVFNPMHDVELDTTSSKEGTGSSTGSSTGDGTTVYNENTTEQVSTTDKEVMSDDISSSSSQSQSSNGTQDSTDAYSDTPQGGLSNVKNLAYLTNARVLDSDTTDSSSGSSTYTGSEDKTTTEEGKRDKEGTKDSTTTNTNKGSTESNSQSTEEYVEKISGKRSLSSFSKYLTEFRQTFLNIDNMVINELNDLFIQLW